MQQSEFSINEQWGLVKQKILIRAIGCLSENMKGATARLPDKKARGAMTGSPRYKPGSCLLPQDLTILVSTPMKGLASASETECALPSRILDNPIKSAMV